MSGSERRAPDLKLRAIGLLARREYGREELRAKLLGPSPDAARREAVEGLLEALVAEGYLSDERYALGLAARKARSHSRRAIGEELKARGVEPSAAGAALAATEIDDAATMLALWRRRFGKAPSDDRDKARQVRFLQSRGFALSGILKLLKAPPADPDA